MSKQEGWLRRAEFLVAIATVIVIALATPVRSCLADESDPHDFVIADGEAA